ncbi:PH domain-containing protein [Leptospira brenneri]|uniref:YokE-like PH domain-containing protein n=1 Tax=Leptospira brenneri TaxID=2023182 RepID=A0A2M9Y6X8_9LEPT|nr:PH domain-containing protein [Leptospira brenneri]PJZ47176.1 hypothetical protein CH361_02185 [Leptospira brenneri]TGK95865.1 hypothetical protein EHQ30_04345 [Leptospira brenneri]
MQTIEQIKTQIQSLLVNHPHINIDILIAYHPGFLCLPEILEDGEKIQGYCMGLLEGKNKKLGAGKWLVIQTGNGFHFVRKLLFKSGFDSISLERTKVKKITTKMGWFFGKIQWETEEDTIEMLQIGKKDYEFFVKGL